MVVPLVSAFGLSVEAKVPGVSKAKPKDDTSKNKLVNVVTINQKTLRTLNDPWQAVTYVQ